MIFLRHNMMIIGVAALVTPSPSQDHEVRLPYWIANYQIAADGWYVANPDLTVVKTRRLERVGKALDEFLDKISG